MMGLLSSIGGAITAGLGSTGFWGGVAGAGASLLSGYIDNYYNRKAASTQNNYQWAFWNANNDYNSPKSQMQRLEEAGLNPNLVYGNGGATHQATMATAPTVRAGRFKLDNLALGHQLANMESQRNLLDAQGREAKAKARIAEKDANIYEATGIRPGSDFEKGLFQSLISLISGQENQENPNGLADSFERQRLERIKNMSEKEILNLDLTVPERVDMIKLHRSLNGR